MATDLSSEGLLQENTDILYRQGKGKGAQGSTQPSSLGKKSSIVDTSSHSPSGSRRSGQEVMEISGNGGNGGGGTGGNGGPPEDPGNGGSHTEGIGNNLSFPGVFPEGVVPLTLRGAMDDLKLTAPYFVPGEYDDKYWFAQKTEGNEWQAGNYIANSPITIEYIDIGDALESAKLATEQFIRVELALYEQLSSPMRAYTMELLGGQGQTEVQGTCATDSSIEITDDSDAIDQLTGTTYMSDWATVYAPMMDLTIQKITDPSQTDNFDWNGSVWTGTGIDSDDLTSDGIEPEAKFGPELNVAGKFICGVSDKPWQFNDKGYYRITFSLPNDATVLFDSNTQVGNYADGFTDPILAAAESLEGDTGDAIRPATVVPDGNTHNGLVYLDVALGTGLDSQFINLPTTEF